MILTVSFSVTSKDVEVWDVRILTAAISILKSQDDVLDVELDPEDSGAPILIATFRLKPGTSTTGILGRISDAPSKVFFAYAEDGGWKSRIVSLQFDVQPEVQS